MNLESHIPLVTKVAKKIARRLPSAVDVDDLVGAGTIGLIDAAKKYDASRCDNFPAYAEIRIRGAILDHLRAMDWLPRAERKKARANESDLAVVSVEDVRADGFDAFVDVAAAEPGLPLESRQRAARLAAAIARLPERVQQVLSLYYVEDLTLKQIGALFGITESRACQLHGQAVKALQKELADDAAFA